MAASLGFQAYGADLQYSSNDSSYATLGEIADVTVPKWMTMAAKATHHASPNNATENAIGIDSSEPLKGTLNMAKVAFAALYALKRTKGYFKILCPLVSPEATPSFWKFYGFFTEFGEIKLDPEDTNIVVVPFTITRASGALTFTQGA